ncbi:MULTISPECIES: ParA family protein [unclassified Oceanispirochaeta]|uniref:ParA family protein n=1 Tax=unclassified Oceanispirochaeta TaxID=2635722 RepID=UPI000E098CC5|nr:MULTISPECIES: ParA family protein [unclassified Oceanispirochaeta]MBF9018960.1 ParA family protein [Oceanispirochaeta sp. M2]NPD75448.1 ParA family protein [Oceanispirochaeta sp. M1]RDG28698.1 ParA family protein [Oceanispirochaeta sp. M1]
MKSIAFAVQKGGTGKTTTAVNVAHGLALKGKKTALIDCDPQGNATNNYFTELPMNELADVLSGKVSPVEAFTEIRENLFMIPTFAIDGGLRLWGETQATKEPYIFDDLKGELATLGFDYVIYDLSPAFGSLERAVMIGADEVITPILPEPFSVDGVEIFASELTKLRKQMRSKIGFNRVVVNNVNMSLGIHKENLEAIKAAVGDRMTVMVVPQDTSLKNAQGVNKSIYEYMRKGDKEAGQSRSVEAYNSIVEVLLCQ